MHRHFGLDVGAFVVTWANLVSAVPTRRVRLVLLAAGALAAGVVGSGFIAATAFNEIEAVRERLEDAAAAAAIASARDLTHADTAARLAFDPTAFDTPVGLVIETGLLDGPENAPEFRPSPNRKEAVKIEARSTVDPFGLSATGLGPFEVSGEAIVRRFPIAALSVQTVDATAGGPVEIAALAAAFGISADRIVPALSVEATLSWAGLERGLIGETQEGGTVAKHPGDVLRAGALALERGRLKDSAVLEELAAALPEDLPPVRLDDLLSVQGVPALRKEPTEFEAFKVSGARLVAALARALVAAEPLRFTIDRPADSIARIEIDLRTQAQAAATPSFLIGAPGASTSLPSMVLSSRATIFGVNLPDISRLEVPLEVRLAGGAAEMAAIACDLTAFDRRYVDLRLHPLRADVVVAPMPAPPGETAESEAVSGDFIPLVETEGYGIWLRGTAPTPEVPPVETTVTAPDLGATRMARLPVDLGQQVRRAVVDGELHIRVADQRLNAATLRDEAQRALSIAAPDLAATLTSVLAAYGLAPGSVSAMVQQISCNGVETVH